MAFPPTEEDLEVPSEFIGEGDLLCGEIMAIRGNPVIDVCHTITDQTDFFFRLIHVWGSQKNHGIVEDNTVGLNIIFSDFLPFGGSLDAADEMLPFRLLFIETLVALIVAIHYACLSGGDNLADKRSFIPFAIGEENLLGNAPIQVKTDVNLGF